MDLPIEPGSVIADKYRIVREIGRGGMGVVFAADHLQLPQQVAVKLLLAGADQTDVERFTREARIVVQIQSEHVCRVLDVGTLPSGEPYVVMELLDGQDLAQLVASEGPLPVPTAIDYVLQACEALTEAHLLGVVHRDLKPNNLFLVRRRDGSACVKVLDFGIAKSQPAGAGSALTQTGSVLGSPRFMSPEQLKSSRDVDLRSDIWSLGAVIYELLSGQAAFAAETMAELCVVILQDEPPPLGEVLGSLPADLSDVVSRCLRKNRADRYVNVAELALALTPFASEQARGSIERIAKLYEATGWTRPSTDAAASAATATAQGAGAPAAGTIAMAQVEAPAVEQTGAGAADPAPPAATMPSAMDTAAAPAAPVAAAYPAAAAGAPQPPSPGPAPFAPAQSAAFPHSATASPARSPSVLWIVLAIGGLVALLAVVGIGALLVAVADSDETTAARSPNEPAPARPAGGGQDGPLADDAPAADIYALAPKLVADAFERHGGQAAIYELSIYRSGYAKIELQHQSKPTSVVRYHYRGGGKFDKKDYAPLDDSERAEVPAAVFPQTAIDVSAFTRVRNDALRRGAQLEQAIVFHIGVKRGDWGKGPPQFLALVEGADGKLNLVYDARGGFVKKL